MRVCQILASAFLANLTASFSKFFGGACPRTPLEVVPPEKIFFGASLLEIGAPRDDSLVPNGFTTMIPGTTPGGTDTTDPPVTPLC